MAMHLPKCPCGNEALMCIVQIPACTDCHTRFRNEGHECSLDAARAFFKDFIASDQIINGVWVRTDDDDVYYETAIWKN